jgi:hypothetical protein
MPKEVEMRTKAILYLALCLSLTVALVQPVPAQTGQTCGGIGGLKCPSGQGCLYPTGQCNQPDLAGTCITVAKNCKKTGPQVCGCDGKTYANECEIAKAGVRPASAGACPAK